MISKELIDKLQLYKDMGETKIPIHIVENLINYPQHTEKSKWNKFYAELLGVYTPSNNIFNNRGDLDD